MRNTRNDSCHTSILLRSRRANAEVMTYRPPRRTARPLSPSLFAGRPIFAYEKYSTVLFIYSYILHDFDKWYRCTFRVLFCVISDTILYYLHGSFKQISNYSREIFQHYVSIFIILFNDSYLNKGW